MTGQNGEIEEENQEIAAHPLQDDEELPEEGTPTAEEMAEETALDEEINLLKQMDDSLLVADAAVKKDGPSAMHLFILGILADQGFQDIFNTVMIIGLLIAIILIPMFGYLYLILLAVLVLFYTGMFLAMRHAKALYAVLTVRRPS